jgi:hypothetical protein
MYFFSFFRNLFFPVWVFNFLTQHVIAGRGENQDGFAVQGSWAERVKAGNSYLKETPVSEESPYNEFQAQELVKECPKTPKKSTASDATVGSPETSSECANSQQRQGSKVRRCLFVDVKKRTDPERELTMGVSPLEPQSLTWEERVKAGKEYEFSKAHTVVTSDVTYQGDSKQNYTSHGPGKSFCAFNKLLRSSFCVKTLSDKSALINHLDEAARDLLSDEYYSFQTLRCVASNLKKLLDEVEKQNGAPLKQQLQKIILDHPFSEIYGRVVQKLFKLLSSRDLTTIFYAFSGMSLKVKQENWYEEFFAVTKEGLNNYNARHLSNIIYACGQIKVNPPQNWLERFFEVTEKGLDNYKVRDLSNIIYACGQIKVKPPQNWLERFFAVSKNALEKFNSQDFFTTFYGFSQFDIKPTQEWLSMFWEVSQRKLRKFKCQELSGTFYACGKLEIQPEDGWMEAFWSVSQGKLSQFMPQDLVNTLYACAQFHRVPDKQWLNKFGTASYKLLPDFNPQNLANIWYACGQLNKRPDKRWIRQFREISYLKMKSFNAQNFSNIIYACGKLGKRPDEEWLQAFWNISEKMLDRFTPQNFSIIIYACGQIGVLPDKEWLNRFWHISCQFFNDFTPQNFSNILNGFAQLNIKPDKKWLEAFWSAFKEKKDMFSSRHLGDIMYACILIGCKEIDTVICEIESRTQDTFDAITWHQLCVVSVFRELEIVFPSDLLEKFKNENNTVSQLEQDSGKFIKKLLVKQNVSASHWLANAFTIVDFFIPDHKLIIQVDGPQHYCANGELNGKTAFQNRLFQHLGYRVLRLDYKALRESFKSYIKQELSTILPLS